MKVANTIELMIKFEGIPPNGSISKNKVVFEVDVMPQ